MPADTLLAVSLTRSDPPLPEQVRAAIAGGADIVELRADCIDDADAVEQLLNALREIPYIVTVRSAAEGGSWKGDEGERLALIERLAALSPDYLDIEWKSGFNPPAGEYKLILSHHDFSGMPNDLDAVFDQMCVLKPDVVKAVFTARDALDSCRVLEQLRRRGRSRPLVALAMGEAGLLTRVLAKKFGAFLTFASPWPGAESAPGQPTIGDLRKVYRWDRIAEQTRVFGVAGWPVSHSLGPRVHNAAMEAEGVDGVYLPLPVEPTYERLAALLDYISDNAWLDFAGLSVTIPHKQNAARWLQGRGKPVSDMARRCGAVNTLVRTSDGWLGENTDAGGAVDALETAPELANGALDGKTVDILGAGGAARAVAAALLERGCQVTIFNRDRRRAADLASQLGCASAPWDKRAAGSGDVLINCTSVGMTPDVGASPVPESRLAPSTVVFDTIYNPARTKLLASAAARGCTIVSGVEMFVGQAARQFTLWHGRSAPLRVLRRAIDGS